MKNHLCRYQPTHALRSAKGALLVVPPDKEAQLEVPGGGPLWPWPLIYGTFYSLRPHSFAFDCLSLMREDEAVSAGIFIGV